MFARYSASRCPAPVFCAVAAAIASGGSCKKADESKHYDGDRPDVVLITLDTTRADHLGCYGHSKPISPNLDRFAAAGALFTQAIAQASVTPVSHASILTGLNPYTHGLRVMHGVSENTLADSQITLAEVLKEAGYATAAFVSAFPVTEHFGLHQGFDVFDAEFLDEPADQVVSAEGVVNTGKNQRRADETTDRALAWLASATSPFFVWIHYFDPHDAQVLPPQEVLARYGRVPEGATERDVLRILYDVEIEYMDAQLGRVLDRIEQTQRADKTVVSVVADHGEGLGDHNWWTHGLLYQEQVRVPLIVRGPGVPAGRRIEYLVRTIDLMPTVLGLAGLERAAWPKMEGHSLVPLLADGATDPGYTAYCDSVNMLTYSFTATVKDVKDDMMFGVVRTPWKYVFHLRRPEETELFDLAADPAEGRNVWKTQRETANELHQDLMARSCIPKRQLEDQSQVSPEVLERLKSLGYLGG